MHDRAVSRVAEESCAHGFVQWTFRPAEKVIGHARHVRYKGWHSLLTASICSGTLLLKQAAKPTANGANGLKVFVVLFGVPSRGAVPIGLGEKHIAKHARIAQA